MYIPETIRVVITNQRQLAVYSADPGYENEPVSPPVNTLIEYTEARGLKVYVTWPVTKPVATTFSATYEAPHVVFDVQEG